MSSAGAETSNSTREATKNAAEDAKKRETFFSFGDEGVTATVGSSGRLMRISRHFSGERIGFCVDDPNMPEPWQVQWRFHEFLTLAENPFADSELGVGIGPSVDGSFSEMVNDRWPTFQGTWEGDTNCTLQYVVSKGTVYQKFAFSAPDSSRASGDWMESLREFEVPLRANTLIRDLDFVKMGNVFNRHESDDDAYKNSIENNCLIREHFNGDDKCVFYIHVLDEESSLEFFDLRASSGDATTIADDGLYEIRRKLPSKKDKQSDGKQSVVTTIILAYTLQYVPKTKANVFSPPKWGVTSETIAKLLDPWRKHSLTNNLDTTLDFFLGRNLEYILSVCSIPIPDPEEPDVPYIALTCGDADGHRISTPASFYAFQVLLLALDFFWNLLIPIDVLNRAEDFTGDTTSSSYVFMMRRRIYNTCKGHIKWLFHKANISGTRFSPNYWVSGEEIFGWAGNEYLPQQFLVNAPFQIIKACEFLRRAEQWKRDVSSLTSYLDDAIGTWTRSLDDMNRSGHCAFARIDEDPINTFYLADHAMIWQAIRLAEMRKLKVPMSYSSQNFRRNILKRFTTENPQSKKRMIASTRSPLQTRFLFRLRDIVLFPAMDFGFFNKPEHKGSSTDWQERSELWTNSVDCQQYHEANDDINWRDPRKFSFSIVMARRQKPMNLRSVGEMYEHAMSVLLRGSSANGLFPGCLSEEGVPVLYESENLRDTFWETTFETPYLMWKYCHESIWRVSSAPDQKALPPPKSATTLILEKVQSISDDTIEIRNALKQGGLTTSKSPRPRLEYSMKDSQPFNNGVAEENIVELQDEWLYNEPSFFVNKANVSGPTKAEGTFVGLKLDVPKSDRRKNEKLTSESLLKHVVLFNTQDTVKDTMGRERTIDQSKKRLWAFFSETPSGNEVCLNTVFSQERKYEEMRDFYERHERYSRFFEEETGAILNIWATELHLSFYRLRLSGMNQERQLGGDGSGKVSTLLATEKKENQMPLVKVVMSFRFEGDFFDRYWTCRLLEADERQMHEWKNAPHVPHVEYSDSTLGYFTDLIREDISNFLENQDHSIVARDSWQQRRVFELRLFGRILKRMIDGAREILADASLSLREKTKHTARDVPSRSAWPEESEYDMFLMMTGDAIITRKHVEKIQRILRTLIANLEENLAQIALWQDRETERQVEKPRWTSEDESRYRAIIHKELVSNNHDVLRLKRILLKITKLEESLVKKLEIIRSDLEEQRGGETQLFTYVTVVFLPLGFATGIFSMSEAPSSRTLKSMIFLAGVALAAVVVLWIILRIVMSTTVRGYWLAIRMMIIRKTEKPRRSVQNIWGRNRKKGLLKWPQGSDDSSAEQLPGPRGIKDAV